MDGIFEGFGKGLRDHQNRLGRFIVEPSASAIQDARSHQHADREWQYRPCHLHHGALAGYRYGARHGRGGQFQCLVFVTSAENILDKIRPSQCHCRVGPTAVRFNFIDNAHDIDSTRYQTFCRV